MTSRERLESAERAGYEAGMKSEGLSKQTYKGEERAAFIRGYYRALMQRKGIHK